MVKQIHSKKAILPILSKLIHKIQDERFSVFTREQIAEKGNSLDLGLIKDDSILDYEDLPNPIDCTEEMIADLSEAQALLSEVVNELKSLENGEA